MIFIEYKTETEQVRVEILLENVSQWKYRYTGDEPFNNSIKQDKPKNHQLGISKNLHDDSHRWEFWLGNKSDEEIDVTLRIKWFEGVNEIAEWIPGEANSDGKIILNANSGIEIFDNGYFLKG